MMAATEISSVNGIPRRMNLACSAIQPRSNRTRTNMIPSTVTTPSQTRASFTRNGTRRLATSTLCHRLRSPSGTPGGRISPAPPICFSTSTLRLGAQVLAEPLLRDCAERPVGVHLLDDPIELLDEARGVELCAAVHRDGQRLVEDVPHDLDSRAPLLRPLQGRQGGDGGVEPPHLEVLDRRHVGVVRGHLRVVDDELDLLAGDVERAVEVELVRAPPHTPMGAPSKAGAASLIVAASSSPT